MANRKQVALLKEEGVEAWNAWRNKNPTRHVDLSGVSLAGKDLSKVNLHMAFLFQTDLVRANLDEANLSHANLCEAKLGGAKLRGADLHGANLHGANLCEAKLNNACLERTVLVETNMLNADITGCRIYGVSVWKAKLQGVIQKDLIITERDEAEATVDDLEVAQFIYLILHNEKIRNVIDTVTSKGILILGRFTPERKAILDALREELRRQGYLPILFDFEKPRRRNLTETVTLLARMARFVVADITDARSIPQELMAIVPSLPSVPVQPLLLEGTDDFGMFKDFQDWPWVLPTYCYRSAEQLIANLAKRVIDPPNARVKAREERRRMIEAELTEPVSADS